MLTVNELHASVEEKEITKGINLQVNPIEVHAIMGPNGSGKSTLSAVIAGHEDYGWKGNILFNGEDHELDAEERAHKGSFIIAISCRNSWSNRTNFIKTAINATEKHKV